jgi:hypothetical protein
LTNGTASTTQTTNYFGPRGAKAEAVRLLDILGWDAVDAGTLAESWRMQPGTPAFLDPYMADPGAPFATRLATDPGRPTSARKIHSALDIARRSS